MPSAYPPLDSIHPNTLDDLIESDNIHDSGRCVDGQHAEVMLKWACTLTEAGMTEYLTPSATPHPVIYFVGGQRQSDFLSVVAVQYKGMPEDEVIFFAPYQLAWRYADSRDNGYPPEFMALCHKLKLGMHKAVLLLATAGLAASVSSR
jgi:hypothetical protein